MGSRPRKILVIRLSAVGDVVNTLPALQAIRAGYPDAVIGFVVEDRAHDLIARHPSVDRVHLYPRKRWARMALRPHRWADLVAESGRFVREIRRERYELALDFQANFKGAMHGLLSGAPRRVGFSRAHCREWNHLFTNEHVTPPGGEQINRVDKFLSLAAWIGAPVDGAGYRLPELGENAGRVGAWIEEAGLPRYAAVHPGTSDFGKVKRWLPERFSQLAARIASELGLRCVVTWGPGERALAEEVVRGAGGGAVLAMETRSVLDLAEIIRRARLFVGCDSGPLHLASAVGTPSVALFGPKDPRIYGPYSRFHRVVYKAANGNGGSMGAITVDDAFRAATDLYSELQAPSLR